MEKQRGSNWSRWDLHIHSTASDGKATPEEIVDQAIEQGLSVIALTDHHTVDNVDRAKEIGKAKGITVIAGVEFRTEYGQRSVHMIGLFPDEHDGMKLTGKAIEENVLNPLGLTRSKIITKAKQEDALLQDDVLAYKKGLLLHQVDFKSAADLIHKHGGLVSVHAGGKSNSLDEEMRHDGPGPKNVDLADSLGPVKEDLLRHYIDICEVRNAREAPFYNATFHLPCIAASDAHKKEEIARNFAWIKADTTFEGLRQVKYEPTERVKIQNDIPNSKRDYQIIDKLLLSHPDFGKQEVPFNTGLNTIIGGRSSGKSLLLGCIAKLADKTIEVKKDKQSYNAFVDSVVKDSQLFWKDGAVNEPRRIDYFSQGYIIGITADPKLRAKLIKELFSSDDERGKRLQRFYADSSSLSGEIHKEFASFMTDYYATVQLKNELTRIGGKSGIEQEIRRLEGQIEQIKQRMPGKLSNEQEAQYRQQCESLERLGKDIEKNNKTIVELNDEDIINYFLDHELPTTIGDPIIFNRVRKEFSELLRSVHLEWSLRINAIIEELKSKVSQSEQTISDITSDQEYKFAKKYYDQNGELTALLTRQNEEKQKLESIEKIEKNIVDKMEHVLQSFEKLVAMHLGFFDQLISCCEGLMMEKDGVRISAHVVFLKDKFAQLVDASFDRRVANNAKVCQFEFTNRDDYVKWLRATLHNLSADQYGLRIGADKVTVAEQLLSTCWFDVQFDIHYQEDNLQQMSEGKAAFVILRLLLDFSSNEFPILIDQPEDELDNRAIFTELVSYIRKKKNRRQIILVTHNPNIVVGADAEEVIVANHHGAGNINHDETKFEYRTGPIEESFNDESSEYILTQKGIREHICEILEGGTEAFIKRERRYRISEK